MTDLYFSLHNVVIYWLKIGTSILHSLPPSLRKQKELKKKKSNTSFFSFQSLGQINNLFFFSGEFTIFHRYLNPAALEACLILLHTKHKSQEGSHPTLTSQEES